MGRGRLLWRRRSSAARRRRGSTGLPREGLRLSNFNVEAQCTPSRSALLTGRHPIRSGTQTVPITGGPDGLTRWEVTSAQALSDAGYATGMWGKWHLGSDPRQPRPGGLRLRRGGLVPAHGRRSPVDDAVVFPRGRVTAAPYAGEAQIPLEPEPIYSRKKGEKAEVIATYDAEFRAGFDRKITEWAIDFMTRAKEAGKPFYVYLPYTQVHIPPIPDPEYAGKTKRGNFADLLVQMDAFTGKILDTLDHLGLAEDTIVVWASDNGGDPTFRYARRRSRSLRRAMDWLLGTLARRLLHLARRVQPGALHHPLAGQCAGRQGQQRAGARGRHVHDPAAAPRAPRSPTTGTSTAWTCATSCSGDAETSGRDTVLCFQGNRLQAVKWRQWKMHLFQQDECLSTWAPYNMPHLHNLEWDPREEHEVDFPHAWVAHPMAAAAGAFMKTLAVEPPIKPGTPDPYEPPKPGELRPEEHMQLGVITQFVSTLVKAMTEAPTPPRGSLVVPG